MTSRIHVSFGRNSVSPRQTTTPAVQVTGANGTRNGRGVSGIDLRSTSTPAQTAVNASSMPIETSSPSTSIGKTPAKNAASTPVMTVAMDGVWYFGCTFSSCGGSSPSRAIAMKMRGCPRMDMRMTEVIPMIAPIFTGRPSQRRPGCSSSATATGAATSSFV